MDKTLKIVMIIIIVILCLLCLIGAQDNTWTKEDEKDAIQGCNKWGGEIIYDQDGSFLDCAINGRLGTD